MQMLERALIVAMPEDLAVDLGMLGGAQDAPLIRRIEQRIGAAELADRRAQIPQHPFRAVL